ncbi:hypothetical protein CONPUDRAFT_153444 [Coniophora puteana RWD-64-598 SS2]|uniref:Fungal-type protein kinase domain-containing protein n=1 Tax=Coniophora puteana (strain RWD-64-598) TaxID=741705 RepID=A0A5M3MP02_CONPW|nr:uncharacterized protein CONPUDRAFT_153444 [Coniophora puteana RWD-64-598 SS2]EIW80902.1 hypothetical protein CONPUDRAFT_153444 [Coniophora puteana RWD-64-598 SS2]
MECVGRISQLSAHILAEQHRTSCFIVMIRQRWARIIRWDRAGAVVTRAFDYKATPHLFEFLWRYKHANAMDRGVDTSHTTATQGEEAAFKEAVENHLRVQIFDGLITPEEQGSFREYVTEHYEPGNVTKLAVCDERSKIIQHYLVSKPTSLPEYAIGMSTRGYWAAKSNLNGDGWEITFLKDTWRDDEDGAVKEGTRYELLTANCAQNVPTVCGHGNVRQRDSADTFPCLGDTFDNANALFSGQKTVTQNYVTADWSARAGRKVMLKAYTHYRLVLEQAAVTLNDFKDSRELFTAVRDVIDALRSARDIQLLHRDISPINILLFRKARGERRYGLLANWDVSSTTNDCGLANDTSSTGTWPFLSVKAARGLPGFRHTLQDDTQSLLYVLLYCCMTLLPHADVNNLGLEVADFFDEINSGVLLRRRGLTKKSWIHDFHFAETSIESYHFEEGVERFLKAFFKVLYDLYFQEPRSYLTLPYEASDFDWAIKKLAQVFDDILGNPTSFVDLKTDKWLSGLQKYREKLVYAAHDLLQSNLSKKRSLMDDLDIDECGSSCDSLEMPTLPERKKLRYGISGLISPA